MLSQWKQRCRPCLKADNITYTCSTCKQTSTLLPSQFSQTCTVLKAKHAISRRTKLLCVGSPSSIGSVQHRQARSRAQARRKVQLACASRTRLHASDSTLPRSQPDVLSTRQPQRWHLVPSTAVSSLTTTIPAPTASTPPASNDATSSCSGPAQPPTASHSHLSEYSGWLDYKTSSPLDAAGVVSYDDMADQHGYLSSAISSSTSWQELQQVTSSNTQQLTQQHWQLAVQRLLMLMPSRLDAPPQQQDDLSAFAQQLRKHLSFCLRNSSSSSSSSTHQQVVSALVQLLRNYEPNTPLHLLSANNRGRYITGVIKQRSSWQQLRQVLLDYGSHFNHIHASALLTHTAQLQQRSSSAAAHCSQQGYQQFLLDTLLLVEQHLPHFLPRQVANCLWAISRLQLAQLHPQLTAALVTSSSRHITAMNNTQLSIMMWSLGNMQHRPDDQWLASFLATSRQLLHTFDLQELAGTAWGLATLGVQPGAEYTDLLLRSAKDAAHKLQSARSRQQTPRRHSSNSSSSSSMYYHSSTPCSIANLVWACVGLGLQPQQYLLQRLRWLFLLELRTCSRTELSMLLWGLVALPHMPSLGWMEKTLQHALSIAASFDPRASALLVYCCARMATGHMQPQGQAPSSSTIAAQQGLRQHLADWLPSFLSATQHLLPSYSPQDLSNIFWGLATLRCQPPPAWLQAAYPALARGLAGSTPQGCANLAWALGRLELQLPPGIANVVLQQTLRQLPAFSSAELVMMLWGVARIRLQGSGSSSSSSRYVGSSSGLPPLRQPGSSSSSQLSHQRGSQPAAPPQHQQLQPTASSSTASPSASPSALQLPSAPASPSTPPTSHAPAAAVEPPPASQLPPSPPPSAAAAAPDPAPPPAAAPPPPAAAAAAAAAAARRLRPPDFWVEQATEHVYDLLPRAFSSTEVTAILRALARLEHRPSAAWLHSLMAELLHHIPDLQPQELCNVLATHAKLQLPVQPQLLDWLWQLNAQQLARWQPRELALLLWAVGKLQLQPPRLWLLLLLAQAAQRMDAFAPREVAAMAYGLAKLGFRLEQQGAGVAQQQLCAQWLQALQRSSLPRLHLFRQQELANVLWSLARLGAAPSAEWLQAYLQAVQQAAAAGEFSCAAAAVQVLGALEGLGVSPGRRWLALFLAAVAPSLEGAQYWELQKLLVSLNSIDMVLGEQWGGRLQGGSVQGGAVQGEL